MDTTKYGQYLLKEPITKARHPEIETPIIGIGRMGTEKGWAGPNINITMESITKPFAMEKETHIHDSDEFLGFIGSNPLDYWDFNAEIELYMGEEREKHVITSPTIVYIPKGMPHCPLIYKTIGKPIVFFVFAPIFTGRKPFNK